METTDEKKIKKEIKVIENNIETILIENQDSLIIAQDYVLQVGNLEKQIKKYWEEPIKKAHEAHKALTKKRAEMLKPVEDRKKILKSKISAYLTEVERKRRIEQERLDKIREEKERKERERLARRAEKAREKGKEDKAQELEEQAEDVYVPQTIVQPEIEKTSRTESGTMSQKKEIKIEIIDLKKVLGEIISGKLPEDIVKINEVKLKRIIKDMKIDVAGVHVEEFISATFRSSK